METAVIVLIIILVTVSAIGVIKGLDLKKWSGWFYISCTFISGLLAGLLRADLYGGLMLGAILAALVLYSGSMVNWHRRRFDEEMARSWLSRNEENPALSLITRVLRRLLNK